jgi:glycine/D-amino acid oxidase-like deaminating enzyme
VRQQFSTPVNIQMSQFAIQVLRHPEWWFPLLETVPDFGFVEGGYLFLASEAAAPTLWANHAVQVEHGVPVEIMTPDELSHRFSWLSTEDIAGGSLGTSGEGWFDATALMQAFQQSARASGVTYVTGEVTGILSFGGRVDAVMLADGRLVECGTLVNATGPRAGALAKFAGVDLVPGRAPSPSSPASTSRSCRGSGTCTPSRARQRSPTPRWSSTRAGSTSARTSRTTSPASPRATGRRTLTPST